MQLGSTNIGRNSTVTTKQHTTCNVRNFTFHSELAVLPILLLFSLYNVVYQVNYAM